MSALLTAPVKQAALDAVTTDYHGASRIIGYSPKTIRRMELNGELKGCIIRRGRSVRFLTSALVRYAEEQAAAGR